jgi:HEAT repeat protein
MTCEEAKLLLADYWSGTLDEAQELAFDTHTASCDRCRAEAERLGGLWKSLALLPAASDEFEPGTNVRTRFYDSLGAYRQGLESVPKRKWRERISALWPSQPAWQMAISFALLVAGIGVGYELHSDKTAQPPVAGGEVAQLREEVSSMRQMVALSLLQQQSAGERLRGVTYAYQAPPSDTEVLSALLTTMNQDQNVNVRLAAVDALHKFGASPVMRAAVLQSIRKQDTPLVQIALIDLLVDLKDTDAVADLANLSNDEKIDSAVREHAKWALGRLR